MASALRDNLICHEANLNRRTATILRRNLAGSLARWLRLCHEEPQIHVVSDTDDVLGPLLNIALSPSPVH